MRNQTQSRAAQLLSAVREKRVWHGIGSVLGIGVVLATVYVLTLPAVTLGQTLICGLEEHVHDGNCYAEQRSLICGLDGAADHVHTDACWLTEQVQLCGKTEHIHSESCYLQEQGPLVPTEGIADPTLPGTEVPIDLTQPGGGEGIDPNLPAVPQTEPTIPVEILPGDAGAQIVPIDPATGLPMPTLPTDPTDPLTGLPVVTVPTDPETGLPLETVPTDPNTGLPVLTFPTDLMTGLPLETVPTDPETGLPLVTVPTDPETGLPLATVPTDPETGLPLVTVPTDPETGLPLVTVPTDPETGLPLATVPMDPETGLPLATVPTDPETGLPLATVPTDPMTGLPLETVPTDPLTGLPLAALPSGAVVQGDPTLDTETQAYWESTLPLDDLTGNVRQDLLRIAESQIGYRESERNYVLTEAGQYGYTRYGAWYGIPYGDWCAMFASFCMHYAGVQDVAPSEHSETLRNQLALLERYTPAGAYAPTPGDLVFFDADGNLAADHIGIVSEYTEGADSFTSIEGNSDDCVQHVLHYLGEARILGFARPSADSEDGTLRLEAVTETGFRLILSGPAASFPFPVAEMTMTAVELDPYNRYLLPGADQYDAQPELTPEEEKISEAQDSLRAAAADAGEIPVETHLFDITLWHDGEEVQPLGPVELTFEGVSTAWDESVHVYHLDEETGEAQNMMPQETQEGTVITTDHFSTYGLMIAKAPPAGVRTVQTTDNAAEGIKLNLFNYYGNNLDEEGSRTTTPVYDGINNPPGHYHPPFLFFAGANRPYGNQSGFSSINEYTGGVFCLQGIVNNTLDANGYPTLRDGNYPTNPWGWTDPNVNKLDYLFDDSTFYGKTVYSNVNGLFQKGADGYYRYDSDTNYAYYNSSTNNLDVYNKTYNVGGTENPIGFFPFNEYDESKTVVDGTRSGGDYYDHQFGMTMEADFWIPSNGKTNDNDIVFNFSGDDDVWVFIDGVLVLDLGGIHGQSSGSINFTDGTVNIYSGTRTVTTQSGVTNGDHATLAEIFAREGKTWNRDGEHHISFFYLERGGNYSNCQLEFNLPIENDNTPKEIEITKGLPNLDQYGGDVVLSEKEFEFQLILGETVYPGPATYSDGTPVSFDADGTFRLKAGQTVVVPNMVPNNVYYIKEVNIDESLISKVDVNGTSEGTTVTPVSQGVYEVKSTETTVKDRLEVQFNNYVRTKPYTVNKVWDGIAAADAPAVSFQLLRRPANDESAQPEVVTYNGMNVFQLSQANNWTMDFEGLPEKDSQDQTLYYYLVREMAVDGYQTSYTRVDGTDSTIITIKNEKLPEPGDVTVVKRWFDDTGEIEVGAGSVDVVLRRKYNVNDPIIPTGPFVDTSPHTVNFHVKTRKNGITYWTDVPNGQLTNITHGSTLESSSAPYGDTSNYSLRATVEGTELTSTGNMTIYPDPSNQYWTVSAPQYTVTIDGNMDIYLSYYPGSSNSGAIEEGALSSMNFRYTVTDPPQDPTPPPVVPTVPTNPDGSPVDPVWVEDNSFADRYTLLPGEGWKKQWTGLETTTEVEGIEYKWVYYVEEVDAPEGFEVTYENNDGITSGTITVNNTSRFTGEMPSTGGTGI